MSHSELIAGGLAAILSATAGFAASTISSDLSFCIVGAIFSGYGAASIKTDPTKGEAERRQQIARRWTTNLACGLPFGPLLGSYATDHLPSTWERPYVFLASGAATAAMGVGLISFGLPALLRKLKEDTPSKLP